jgi:hypothetical protein
MPKKDPDFSSIIPKTPQKVVGFFDVFFCCCEATTLFCRIVSISGECLNQFCIAMDQNN